MSIMKCIPTLSVSGYISIVTNNEQNAYAGTTIPTAMNLQRTDATFINILLYNHILY